jgi:biopolymer transport protein ExbD
LDVSDSPAPRSAGQWIFHFDLNGHLYVGGYTVDENDLPELVKQWHVTSALVQGSPGSNFKDAVKIENELKAAGVANVSIAQ